MTEKDLLLEVYKRLRNARGHQGWWPAKTPFEVVVGAVLTQNTSWKNVERAILALEKAGCLSPFRILAISEKDLASLIKPAGYYNVKARRLRAIVDFIVTRGNGKVEGLLSLGDTLEIRNQLLQVSGIGRETADSILLYALGKPIFVVDAYTRRLFGRLGLIDPKADYDKIRDFFESRLGMDPSLFNDYHAQIVAHGKEVCKKSPRCQGCILSDLCSFFEASLGRPWEEKSLQSKPD